MFGNNILHKTSPWTIDSDKQLTDKQQAALGKFAKQLHVRSATFEDYYFATFPRPKYAKLTKIAARQVIHALSLIVLTFNVPPAKRQVGNMADFDGCDIDEQSPDRYLPDMTRISRLEWAFAKGGGAPQYGEGGWD